jgi:tRNA nucleotidyltransferase (CCA-adding enzyme)
MVEASYAAESFSAVVPASMTLDTSALTPPEGFLEVANRLEQAGFKAWAVGGAVRDACVGKVGKRKLEDWDIATEARPKEVGTLFSRTVPIGVEYGTVGVLFRDEVYEVTTFRRDVQTDGRHAQVTFADSIEEDLARRDFTINAIAWRPRTGDVRDPFDGVSDFEDGVLRAVGTAAHRFKEDYLRVLRGMRFAGRFNLELEVATANAMSEAVGGLPRLSAERVREELMKVLTDRVPSSALCLYTKFGVLTHWYPELVRASLNREIWFAAFDAVDAVSCRHPFVRLARWLVQAGEDAAERSAASLSLLNRLKFSNAQRGIVGDLVGYYLPFVDALDSPGKHRCWLSEVGESWHDVIRLHVADARSAKLEHRQRDILMVWRLLHQEKLQNPPLQVQDLEINGNDILKLGVSPGPMVGFLLEHLLEKVLEDPRQNARETLIAATRYLLETGVAPESLSSDA